MKYTPKTKEWFVERIGKRIYRDSTHCVGCRGCENVENNGLIVGDEEHAEYLATIDSDFAWERVYCNYRDEKNI